MPWGIPLLGANDALRHSPAGGEWCLEAFPCWGRMMPWGIPLLGANDALRHSPAGGEWCLEAFPCWGRMMPWGIPLLGANDALRHSPAGGEWCLEAFPCWGRMMPWGNILHFKKNEYMNSGKARPGYDMAVQLTSPLVHSFAARFPPLLG